MKSILTIVKERKEMIAKNQKAIIDKFKEIGNKNK